MILLQTFTIKISLWSYIRTFGSILLIHSNIKFKYNLNKIRIHINHDYINISLLLLLIFGMFPQFILIQNLIIRNNQNLNFKKCLSIYCFILILHKIHHLKFILKITFFLKDFLHQVEIYNITYQEYQNK